MEEKNLLNGYRNCMMGMFISDLKYAFWTFRKNRYWYKMNRSSGKKKKIDFEHKIATMYGEEASSYQSEIPKIRGTLR